MFSYVFQQTSSKLLTLLISLENRIIEAKKVKPLNLNLGATKSAKCTNSSVCAGKPLQIKRLQARDVPTRAPANHEMM